MVPDCFKVAIVGGGITGCSVASTLAKLSADEGSLQLHVFDQGRSGVGGRTSHRIDQENSSYRWDHGCQLFRADTPKFRAINEDWIEKGFTQEWTGRFGGDGDFFGFPHQPPFYTAIGGIKSICKSLANEYDECITVHEGRRVVDMKRSSDNKWKIIGTGDEAAFHDTPESVARAAQPKVIGEGFHAVVMTDLSSSFGSWHRASAGVPAEFAKRVQEKAGARVPLFTCMIAFEHDVNIDLDAFSMKDNDTLWFAARTKSKPGLNDPSIKHDCWTLVSTPEYAMREIASTPMQDPQTGEFIPQSPEYLKSVPGPALESAFRGVLKSGFLAKPTDAPKTVYLGAQRWGSALPAHRHLDEASLTRKEIAGVAYDSGKAPLAPTSTTVEGSINFVKDESLMLFQAGDMVSSQTPGFESAALSGIETAEYIYDILYNN